MERTVRMTGIENCGKEGKTMENHWFSLSFFVKTVLIII